MLTHLHKCCDTLVLAHGSKGRSWELLRWRLAIKRLSVKHRTQEQYTMSVRCSASRTDQTRPVLHRTRPMWAFGANSVRKALCTCVRCYTGRVWCVRPVLLSLCGALCAVSGMDRTHPVWTSCVSSAVVSGGQLSAAKVVFQTVESTGRWPSKHRTRPVWAQIVECLANGYLKLGASINMCWPVLAHVLESLTCWYILWAYSHTSHSPCSSFDHQVRLGEILVAFA